MKILMVSIFSPHFFNWTLQLKESDYDIYWLDVLDMESQVERISFVEQTVGWRNRYNYPGRYWVKHKTPWLHKFLCKFNQRKFIDVFEKRLEEINPDVVHSFEMYSGTASILKVMSQRFKIKWIYSAWGNDYYFSNQPKERAIMSEVFSRLDYLFTDCHRDFQVAESLGFNGKYLGTFPGGGGYDISSMSNYIRNSRDRKVILLKGYQNKFGRCNFLLESLYQIKNEINDYCIVVFGATQEVFEYSKNMVFPGGLEVYGTIGRKKVFQLMGQSLIYMGNSISDGMPNTLLEAIIMEVFPIQSNPGGATDEMIQNGKNGLVINDPEDPTEIAELILKAIQNPTLISNAVEFNRRNITPYLDKEYIQSRVQERYLLVEEELKVGSESSCNME